MRPMGYNGGTLENEENFGNPPNPLGDFGVLQKYADLHGEWREFQYDSSARRHFQYGCAK